MLQKARGIVLHLVKYSETSVIVKVYTDSHGLKSFLVRGIRSKKSKLRPGLFQPLSLLDLVFYHRENSSLGTLKETHHSHPYRHLHSDILKSSIALFINEIIYKTLREEEANPELFDFLWERCISLDQAQGNLSSFPIIFMISYSRFLGIPPRPGHSETSPYFNLQEGIFQPENAGPRSCFDKETSAALNSVMIASPDELQKLVLTSHIRSKLLTGILSYFRYHLQGFPEIHSHQVLHTVLA
jgi:DNA repair protein RecO (recombination protein O)